MASSDIHVSPEEVAEAERYRKQKDTAVLSLVFGDFCNSTRLLEELGEVRYDELRRQREAVIESHVTRDGAGAIVKTMGDGFLAVFSEPSTAVDRSLHVQACLPRDPQFGLRIGIDMGQVARQRQSGIVSDVFGRHVNRAARIEALAEVGSILSSFVVYDSAVGWLRDTVRWIHRHPVLLRGFSEPMSLHEPERVVAMPPTLDLDMRQFVLGALEGPLSESRWDPYDDVVASLRRKVRVHPSWPTDGREFATLWVDDHPQNNRVLVKEPDVAQARDIAIRVIAKLNIERRKLGEKPLDIKTIERLQQYLADALSKRALNKLR